jgi:hypothetical protein
VRSLFSNILSAGALVVLVVLVVHRREIRAAFGTPYHALVGMVLVLGSNVAALLMPGRTALALGAVAGAFLVLVLYGMAKNDVLGGLDPARRTAWYLTGVLIGWCFAVDVGVGHGVYQDRYLAYGATVLAWLATGLLAGQVATALAAWAYAGGALLSLLTVTAAVDDSLWGSCMHGDFEKCSPAGALFRSFATSENYVAILGGFTIVAAIAALRGAARLVIVAHGVVVMIATGSRTGMVAVAAALVVLAVGRVVERRRVVARLPRWLAAAAATAACGTGLYLVLSSSPEALSRRGAIWAAVRRHLGGDLLTGVGVSKWAYYQGVGESPQHFFHSSYALVLFAGGLVGIGVLGLWSYLILCGTTSDGRAVTVAAPTVLLLVNAMTEVVWNPFAFDGLSWMVVALLCTGSCRTPKRQPPDDLPDRHLAVALPRSADRL